MEFGWFDLVSVGVSRSCLREIRACLLLMDVWVLAWLLCVGVV